MIKDEKYEYWFACIRPLSDRKKALLWEKAGCARAVYYIEENQLKKMEFLTEKDRDTLKIFQKKTALDMEYEKLIDKKIRFVPFFDKAYPERLKTIADPPYALFVRGKIPRDSRPAVAIVGARKCSAYGEREAIRFASGLASCGVQVISGMARGVDGAAGRGALSVGGDSYAVLGSGVDVCYPRENRGLYEDLMEKGGILSEQLPGAAPRREYFPRRNRIISGLADAVLIMEAGERSGSLITADIALEQGKDVFALPGPVDSPLSRGCNELIRQGAGILLSPGELAEDLKLSVCSNGEKTGDADRKQSDKNKKVLESTENIVYSCLGLYPRSVSQLSEETKLPPAVLVETLVSLELKGYIREISKNHYIRSG